MEDKNMSGECDKCGEHALECRCYERCQCDKHPSTHEHEFDMIFSEFGMLDTILIEEAVAVCKTCKDKFNFIKRNYK